MATATLIPLSEYLNTTYRPDVDYVDGRIEERHLGEKDHSFLQRKLLLLLSAPATEPFFICSGELRVQVSAENYRVPDLAVLREADFAQQIQTTPPMLCIEILSPDDTIPDTLLRARDFIRIGVPEVWIFNPKRRNVSRFDGAALITHEEDLIRVPGTPISISISETFSAISPKVADR